MKILLDENLPNKLKFYFSDEHQIFPVREKSWNGSKNGEFLGLMSLDGFNAFITIDKNLQYQQNIRRYPVKNFILDATNNKLETLAPFAEKLKAALDSTDDNQIIIISV